MNPYDIYRDDWAPPHCPNPKCKFHHDFPEDWPFKRMGFYLRKVEPKCIRRFLCKACGVSFSSQTFSTTYWQKRPDIMPKLFDLTCGSMGNRQIANALKVAPSTIDRQLNRLGRHCALYFEEATRDLKPPDEIIIDGFESFELSQDYPFHFHLAVDKNTSFILGFTDSPLRRKGMMTPEQRQRREEREQVLGRPDPRAVRKDMSELLEKVTAGAEEMFVYSDAHKSYPPAMRAVPCRFHHVVTSSRKHRDQYNNLFEINLLDLKIRHGSGNHKRETIGYSKRRNAAALRLMIFKVWRNFMQPRRARRCKETPAMLQGLCDRMLTWEDVLARRLFIDRVELMGRMRDYYFGEVETRGLEINRRHDLKLAV